MSTKQKLVYFCTESTGGYAKYTKFQAEALEARNPGSIIWVSPLEHPPPSHISHHREIPPPFKPSSMGLPSALDFLCRTLSNYRELDKILASEKAACVLMPCWGEYFSPFWAWRLRKWQRKGVRFGAIIHDPVRDFVLGPTLWHRNSVSQAYSFLDVAYVHEDIALDTGWPQRQIKAVTIPHGPYTVPVGLERIDEIRTQFAIPSSAYVILFFGHVRDGKNLDLLLRAIKSYPEVWLIVAGKEQSSSQKPVAFYKDLATKLGIADRCCWVSSYIPEDEIWKYFVMADSLALTYNEKFTSASGVMNINVQFKKPVLVSSGEGPLQKITNDYNLGVWVKPDSLDALVKGIAELRSKADWNPVNWVRYESSNSWKVNAQRIWDSLLT